MTSSLQKGSEMKTSLQTEKPWEFYYKTMVRSAQIRAGLTGAYWNLPEKERKKRVEKFSKMVDEITIDVMGMKGIGIMMPEKVSTNSETITPISELKEIVVFTGDDNEDSGRKEINHRLYMVASFTIGIMIGFCIAAVWANVTLNVG